MVCSYSPIATEVGDRQAVMKVDLSASVAVCAAASEALMQAQSATIAIRRELKR